MGVEVGVGVGMRELLRMEKTKISDKVVALATMREFRL